MVEGVFHFEKEDPADREYPSVIEAKFRQKKEIASRRERQLFGIFDGTLTEEEEAALKFLFAYMPLNDLADYDGGLFLKHVRETFRIRRLLPWGEKIPDRIFLHFVLPYRVNNENIEDYRGVLFEALYGRIKDLPMTEAILEVNHWCHEKASYIGCDPRTSSPLSVIRRALGRCGEESTLAVAALRSVRIPARQCYTPRWAHCDSNHAWVEAWADGKWYYFGACEPYPRLNGGWFKDPARRAMLVNTRIPGNYSGPEETTLAHAWYTEINLLGNYAPSKKITVKVKDEEENPVPGAEVHFQVYNSAAFSTIARLTADDRGEVSLTTGLGDLLLHAAGDGVWGFGKAEAAEKDYFELTVSGKPPVGGTLELDMVPPRQTHAGDEEPPEEEVRRNDRRLKEEDAIRAEYEATFLGEARAREIAAALSLPADRVWKVLEKARGNSHEIAAFLREEAPGCGEWALILLESLAEKDLTDTFRPVLKDHLYGATAFQGKYDDPVYTDFILCPRVAHEMLGEYRAFFRQAFSGKEQEDFRQQPDRLVEWVKSNIQVLEGYTYYQGSATPKGSCQLGKADRTSRDIAFVAMARSFGIPARLQPADQRPQFLTEHGWNDAALDSPDIPGERRENCRASGVSPGTPGRIRLLKDPAYEGKAEYSTNFTLARFDKNLYKTLNFHGTEWSEFEKSVEVLPGSYRMITGNRLDDGTVLVRMTVFSVQPGETAQVALIFRQTESSALVLGTVPEEFTFTLAGGSVRSLREVSLERGMVAAWIKPDKEPSRHLLRELRELSKELEAWGGPVFLCVCDDMQEYPVAGDIFAAEIYRGLPKQACFGMDIGSEGLNALTSMLQEKPGTDFPLVVVIDPERQIRYLSTGYKLGIGTEVVKTLKLLEAGETGAGPAAD